MHAPKGAVRGAGLKAGAQGARRRAGPRSLRDAWLAAGSSNGGSGINFSAFKICYPKQNLADFGRFSVEATE